MPGLERYMAQYDHGIGIPLIFAGLILFVFLRWKWGAFCFIAGWILLFLGHRIEGNNPAFFQGPVYLLVGPIWVAKEFWEFLTGSHKPASHENAAAKKP